MIVIADVMIAMIYVNVYRKRVSVMIVRWVISPVVRRIPSVITGSPEEGEYRRSININRFDDVIRSINIGITNYLYVSSAVPSAFYNDGGYILENISVQYGLNNNHVRVPFRSFDYPQVIYLTILI